MPEKNRCRHLSICSVKWAVNGPFVCALFSRFFVHRNRCELCRSLAHKVRTSSKYVIRISNCGLEVLLSSIYQGSKNYGRQVSLATKFCTAAPTNFGFSVWNLFHVITLAFRFLEISYTISLYPLYCSWGSSCVSFIQTQWLSHVLTYLNWNGHSCSESRNLHGSIFFSFFFWIDVFRLTIDYPFDGSYPAVLSL
jgi:hypothetical protein